MKLTLSLAVMLYTAWKVWKKEEGKTLFGNSSCYAWLILTVTNNWIVIVWFHLIAKKQLPILYTVVDLVWGHIPSVGPEDTNVTQDLKSNKPYVA